MSMWRVYFFLNGFFLMKNCVMTPVERKGIRFLFRNPAAEPFQ